MEGVIRSTYTRAHLFYNGVILMSFLGCNKRLFFILAINEARSNVR